MMGARLESYSKGTTTNDGFTFQRTDSDVSRILIQYVLCVLRTALGATTTLA